MIKIINKLHFLKKERTSDHEILLYNIKLKRDKNS